MRPGDVRLLSANWLVERAKKGQPLSRRQELPEEAFLSVAQLKAIQAEARPLFYPDLIFDEITGMLAGEGFFKHMCGALAAHFQLRNKRNADKLLPIIAVSYCWLEAAHPDRDGHQLQLMFEKLQALYARAWLRCRKKLRRKQRSRAAKIIQRSVRTWLLLLR